MPVPVTNYLAAEKAKDAGKLAACFATDGLVHDEGKDYRGIDAIRAWKQQADAKYQHVMEPIDASVMSEKTVKLRARLVGNFPGSPVELDFTFTLENDKITALEHSMIAKWRWSANLRLVIRDGSPTLAQARATCGPARSPSPPPAAGLVGEGVALSGDHVGHDRRQRQPQAALDADVLNEDRVPFIALSSNAGNPAQGVPFSGFPYCEDWGCGIPYLLPTFCRSISSSTGGLPSVERSAW